MSHKRQFPGVARQVSRWVRQKLLHGVTPDGFTPITKFLPADVFIVGYPKSGNTWFQALISGAVYGVLPELAPMSVVQDLVPDVHAQRWYKRHATPMFFKSHEMPNAAYRRVIYLLRDGRDVMVSYLHYQEALEGRPFDFLEFVRDKGQAFPCKWHQHVEAWLENRFGAEMILVRYEDLHADPVNELGRVCEFAGIERSARTLELAARSAAFEKMQAKELREGPYSARWPREKLFCRRGVAGSHRQEMPRKVLEAFTRESASVLNQFGYC